MTKALGYARVSTEGQSRSGLSLDAQQFDIERYHSATIPDVTLYAPPYVDADVSATSNMFLTRPAGLALDAAAKKGDHVLIARGDRAFRDQLDFALTTGEWFRRGVHIHVIDSGLDSRDPSKLANVRLIWGIKAAVAEYEAAQIGSRKRAANIQARATGRPTNGSIPPGWKLVGPPRFRKLVLDQAERLVILRIVAMRDAGKGYGEIAAQLQAERVLWRKVDRKAPRGFTLELWCRHRVRRAYEAVHAQLELQSPSLGES